jgi:hypothetical protein
MREVRRIITAASVVVLLAAGSRVVSQGPTEGDASRSVKARPQALSLALEDVRIRINSRCQLY